MTGHAGGPPRAGRLRKLARGYGHCGPPGNPWLCRSRAPGGSGPASAVIPQIRDDMPFALELLFVGVLVLIPLRLVGGLISLAEPADGGDQ